MHGLINRSVQSFVRDTYGASAWSAVVASIECAVDDFEAMQLYDDQITYDLVAAVAAHLGRPADTVLEDLGTYLVSHPNMQAVRRLLRFGGDTFREFLLTLDDLRDRARAAVRHLELPAMELKDHDDDRFTVTVSGDLKGFGHVMVGVLRAMADDYGALALLDLIGHQNDGDIIEIQLLDTEFAEGNSFSLALAEADQMLLEQEKKA